MKITACFKTSADWGSLPESFWKWDVSLQLADDHVVQGFNCFDESALEMALQLCEQAKNLGSDCRASALTISNEKADLFLKKLYAVEFDEAVRVQPPDDCDLRFNPMAVSSMIAAAIGTSDGPGLALFGKRSSIGDNGQTGLLVAERLGWPVVQNVIDAALINGESIKTTSQGDSGRITQEVKLPAVLIVSQPPKCSYLRVPTLRQRLDAKSRSVTVLHPDDLGIDPNTSLQSDRQLVDLQRRRETRSITEITGTDAAAKAKILYDRIFGGGRR